MKSLSTFIKESVNEDLNIVYPTSSTFMPFILVKSTSKAYLLKWRTKSEEREQWVPKMFAKESKLPIQSGLESSYAMFEIMNKFIFMIRLESDVKVSRFFDDWHNALTRLSTYQIKQVSTEKAKAAIKHLQQEFNINFDWIEIDNDGSLIVKTPAGLLKLSVTNDKQRTTLRTRIKDVNLEFTVGANFLCYFSNVGVGLKSIELKELLYLIVGGKADIGKLYSWFTKYVEAIDPQFTKAARLQYAEGSSQYHTANQIANIMKEFNDKRFADLLSKRMKY
jgi:hypothetical protein